MPRLMTHIGAACNRQVMLSKAKFGGLRRSVIARGHSPSQPSSAASDISPSPGSRRARKTMETATALGSSALSPVSHPTETLDALKIPPPDPPLGARVHHVMAPATQQLSESISAALCLPKEFSTELIRFGAVHFCRVHPEPRPEQKSLMDDEHLQQILAARARGIARDGRDPRLSVPRRASSDVEVPEGSYIRCHVHPKRFPGAYTVRWKDRIVAQGSGWVVMNKPGGCPVVPAVDNVLECLLTLSAEAVQSHDSLLVTHRLDQCTEGLVVLGKTPSFVKYFNELLRAKDEKVAKVYRTLTANPPPLGPMVHHVTTGNRKQGEPSHTLAFSEKVEGSSRCELVVMETSEVQLTGWAKQSWGPTAWESTLQLITGRTHQIRAQLAAEGCPLLGDSLYLPLAAAPEGSKTAEIHLFVAEAQGNVLPDGERRLMEPSGGIGLQAYKLRIDDDEDPFGIAGQEFVTGTPWWRAEAE